MAGLQLTGLASGFDWKSFVDSMISLERTPANRLESEQVLNLRKSSALSTMGTRLTALKTANQALNSDTLFKARTATSSTSGSTWSPSAATSATVGTHTFNVTRLATSAVMRGASDVAAGIATTSDVSGVTLAALPTATAVTAGQFTVNGARVTVATTDSLADVFAAISAATGGDVTAAYDENTDTISLSSASEIVLGASNDTSNFLAVAKLANNGTGSITSANGLGTADRSAALTDARLKTAITAVDGSGAGSFTINGVAIDYNVNDDSIDDIIDRINAAGAGVNASYDAAADRMNLTNATTGDLGIGLSEGAGGLLAALGLTTGAGASLTRGVNAQFSVDGGATLTSTSNTLSADVHGLTGLDLRVDSTGSQSITVAADTDSMRSKIDAFISAFNSAQTYIDDQTKVVTSSTGVTTATLASNREVQDWARSLRGAAFNAITGATGGINRLESLGIDFVAGTSTLAIKDSAKLEAALTNQAEDVDNFFNSPSTGFFARMDSMLANYVGSDGTGGYLDDQVTSLAETNKRIDQQIADIDRRLEQRRAVLESSFIAMETAQSKIQQMQSQIANAFPSTSSSSKK